jgi:hypothetical protein
MRFDRVILALAVFALPVHAQVTGAAAVRSRAAKPRPAAAVKASSGPGQVALTESSDLVGGPLIGYAVRADRSGVYPLHGFPGAAFPGPTWTLAQAGGSPVVSSVGGYALAAGERPGELLLYGLRSNTASGRLLPSAFAVNTQPDKIVLSPLGGVALLYDRARHEAEILAGLPGRPISLYTVSLAGVQGVLTALAVSDDGLLSLAAFSTANDSGTIYALRRDAPASPVSSVSRVVHLAFVPKSQDGLAADYESGQILLLKDGGLQGVQLLAGRNDGLRAPTAVEASTAGTVFALSEASGILFMVRPGQSGASQIPCGCAASGLERLKNADSFRLTTTGVIAVLEADRDQPDVYYIPAAEEADQQPSNDGTLSRGRNR